MTAFQSAGKRVCVTSVTSTKCGKMLKVPAREKIVVGGERDFKY